MTVYFIKPIGMDGPIKIGCSYSPDNRLKTLSTWAPFALEIVATVQGDIKLERRFHALFAETHQRREWFGWSKRLAATIAAINDGSFDVTTLPDPICVTALRPAGYVHPGRGRKWSEAQHERHRQQMPMRRAERLSGLVLDYPSSAERRAAFIANPCRETGGITKAERTERLEAWHRNYHAPRAEQAAAA